MTTRSAQTCELERTTSRIGESDGCGCRGPIVFDEVCGWLHLVDGSPCARRVAAQVPLSTDTRPGVFAVVGFVSDRPGRIRRRGGAPT